MLKFGDKIIYIEGVLVEIRDDGSAAIDLKGRLGYLEVPQWMLLHEHPLVVGQEFGWNMSFPEQLGPVAAPVRYPEITKVAEGETFVMEGRVNDVQDGATGLQLTNCPGGFRFPMRMFLTDYEIKNDQPVAWTMSAPKQLSAEPNKKYVSNHDMYMRRQAEMQAKKDN